MNDIIHIDGSQGEGGGQIIRSSLALSAVTGKPFEVVNVRAGRAKPGLKRQHVTCVKAAQAICEATVEGAELQSNRLSFTPGKISPGDYQFDIGTAGSASLVMQTVLPALMIQSSPSTVTVRGGTHNRQAPPFDFLNEAYLPLIARMGPSFQCNLLSYGFYPAGGGEFSITISPSENLNSLEITQRKHKPKVSVEAIVSSLPLHIAEREVDIIRRKARLSANDCHVTSVENPRGPGNVVMIRIKCGNVTEIVTGFGEKGIKAENVARSTYRDAKPYLDSEWPIGEYLCDQLMLPMGLAAAQGKSSQFFTGPLSLHATTHIDILKRFLDIEIEATNKGDGVLVTFRKSE